MKADLNMEMEIFCFLTSYICLMIYTEPQAIATRGCLQKLKHKLHAQPTIGSIK